MAKLRRLQPQDYTVAWLCALPKSELVVATMMLEERHEDLQLSQQDKISTPTEPLMVTTLSLHAYPLASQASSPD